MSDMVWGGTTLPGPKRDGIREELSVIGTGRRMLSGRYRTQVRATKQRFTVSWEGLTRAERDSLLAVYSLRILSSASLTLPDGQTLTAMAAINTWTAPTYYARAEGGDTPYYDVSFTIEEE